MFSSDFSKRVNGQLFACLLAGYLLPTTVWIITSLLNGLILWQDVVDSLLHPLVIPSTLVTMTVYIFFVRSALRKIKLSRNRGDSEGANRFFSQILHSFIPPILIIGFLQVIFVMAVRIQTIPYKYIIGLVNSVSLIYLYATPFFLWFENRISIAFGRAEVTRSTFTLSFGTRLLMTTYLPGICLMAILITSSIAFALRLDMEGAPLSDHLSTMTMNLIIIGVFLLGILTILYRRTIVMIQRPVNDMVKRFEAAKNGIIDRTPLNTYTRDEFGLLNDSYLSFFNTLHESLSLTGRSLTALELSNQTLLAHMEESASAVSQIHSSIQTINGQIDNQSVNVHQTSSSVEEFARSIDSLNLSIDQQSANMIQSNQAVEEMMSGINSVYSLSGKTDENVEHLGRASIEGNSNLLEISSLISAIEKNSKNLMEANNLISNIASQTNLLAMNAAIEAAHAGHAGRGFSVVAGEIRKLAESASRQSKAIRENLDVEINLVLKAVESEEKTRNSFSAISDSHKGVRSQVSHLYRTVKEQDRMSQEIRSSLEEVNSITSMVKSGSKEMTQVNNEMLSSVQNLKEINTEVQQLIEEISAGSGEIEISTQELISLGNTNLDNIKNLEEKLSFFKL
ncbi:MAG: methyl-accepting chemotaxis protein [Spirochaetales bacterium]|nr:methyl-accepting chemotaxis protein [Spirochaetales bacterium]